MSAASGSPDSARLPGTAAPAHRCARCLHPMAPGPGVPETRFGAFREGMAANCNECGWQVPAGSRMLCGGTSRADDPRVGSTRRLLVSWLIGPASALAGLLLFVLAIQSLADASAARSNITGSVLLFGLAFACLALFVRNFVRPLWRGTPGAGKASRSTWLVGSGLFEEWKAAGPGIEGPRMGGPVLAATVIARNTDPGSKEPTLDVTVHVIDGVHVSPDADAKDMLRMLLGLQRNPPRNDVTPVQPVLHTPFVSVAQGQVRSVAMGAALRPLPTIHMRLPAGEAGLEDAMAAARTIAWACIGERTRDPAGALPCVTGASQPPMMLRRRRRAEGIRRASVVILVAVASISSLLAILGIFVLDPGAALIGLLLGLLALPVTLLGSAKLLRANAPTISLRHGDPSKTWEASPDGLLSIEVAADRMQAAALAVPAAILERARADLEVTQESAWSRASLLAADLEFDCLLVAEETASFDRAIRDLRAMVVASGHSHKATP